MKLLGSVPSPFTRKVRIVLAEKRVECAFELVDVMAADSPVPAHNPLGKVPVLVLDDGATLYDSRVIAEFLDTVSPKGRLIPEENRDRINRSQALRRERKREVTRAMARIAATDQLTTYSKDHQQHGKTRHTLAVLGRCGDRSRGHA